MAEFFTHPISAILNNARALFHIHPSFLVEDSSHARSWWMKTNSTFDNAGYDFVTCYAIARSPSFSVVGEIGVSEIMKTLIKFLPFLPQIEAEIQDCHRAQYHLFILKTS